MGQAIPQIVTEDRASGAQIIDGSLKIDGLKKNYLKRTPGSAGNRRTWTWSCWVKKPQDEGFSEDGVLFEARIDSPGSTDENIFGIRWRSNGRIGVYDTGNFYVSGTREFRDTNAFYHLVLSVDTTQASDNISLYVNGDLYLQGSYTQNSDTRVNDTCAHRIGARTTLGSQDAYFLNSFLAQQYFIDGQALGPEEFGFTDPLTNTWRPKKYTGNFNIFPDINLASTGSGEALEVVINRQVDKAWIKNHGSSEYQGGGDPSDPTSAPTFHLPSGGSLYWFTTAYDSAHTMVIGSSSETGTQPEWASGGTTGSLTRDSATTVSGTPASAYSSARTDALADNTVYAFTYTITTGTLGNHTGWFLSTSTSYSSGVPDEQTSGNTVGARFNGSGDAYYGFLAVYGSFASINPYTYYSSYPRLDRRGINSFYLPFDGNSPIGKDLSRINPLNDGRIWSNSTTGSFNSGASQGADKAFNGTTSGTNYAAAAASSTAVFTNMGITGITKIRLSIAKNNNGDSWGNLILNDGSSDTNLKSWLQTNYPGTGNSASFIDVTSQYGASTLQSISIDADGSTDVRIAAVEINNVVLIDDLYGNSFTPVNFGGTLTIDKATGALPILNTTQGGTHPGPGVRTDPFANNLVLAVPLTRVAEDKSNEINSGSTQKTINVNGNVQSSKAQSNFYGESFYFDGSGDYITTSSSTELSFGAGDFTIELWYNAPSGESGYLLDFRGNTNIYVYLDDNNIYSNIFSTYTDDSFDVWHHLAIVRSSNIATLYIDGVAIQSVDNSTDYGGVSTTYTFGTRYTPGTYDYAGYLSDIRVYKGVAKYTKNFTLASTKPAILPDSPSGVSGSSKLTKITDGAVYFDGSGDSLSLSGSSDVQFGTGIFTAECFVYADGYPGSGVYGIFDTGTAVDGNRFSMVLYPSGLISIDNNTNLLQSSSAMMSNAWNHVAFVREGTGSNEAKLYINGVLSNQATISTDFNNDDLLIGKTIDDYSWKGWISNVRIVKGTAVYTSNFTPPTASLTNVTNTKLLCCQSTNDDKAANMGGLYASSSIHTTKADVLANGTLLTAGQSISNQYLYLVPNGDETESSSVFIFGDDGAVTNSDSSNRWQWIYRDGGSWATTSGSYNTNNWDQFYYGDDTNAYQLNRSRDFYAIFTFGESTSQPYQQSGTAPTITTFAKAAVSPGLISKKGIPATNNFNPFNTDINKVRGLATGYATWNPLNGPTNVTYSDGNLFGTQSSTDTKPVTATVASPSGKYYCEIIWVSGSYFRVGIQNVNVLSSDFGGDANGIRWESNSGNVTNAGGTSYTSTVSTYAVDDVLGIAWDNDNGRFYVSKNGVWQGGHHPSYSTNPIVSYTAGLPFTAACTTGTNAITFKANFGQKPFKYTPPDGFQPLNLASARQETVITRPDQFVSVDLYTGTGANQRIETGMKPDLIWIKSRNQTTWHNLTDSVRGLNKSLFPNEADAETTETDIILSTDSTGFTLGADGNSDGTNVDTKTYVAWTWKAGGNAGTWNKDDVSYASAAAAGLDGGSMTLTGASVGTKQGFSIVKYQGTNSNESIPHGLGSVPAFYVCKAFDNSGYTDSWNVYHKSLGNAAYLKLQSSDDATTGSTIWNSTSPTDSLFYVASSSNANENGIGYVSYIWADVPGLQKFGSFEATGNTNGPFVELGFTPALLWCKSADSNSRNWMIFDSTRSPTNPDKKYLIIDGNGTEGNYNACDFLSNGFKVRATSAQELNITGETYIYCAWAEVPTVNLFGGQSNAR